MFKISKLTMIDYNEKTYTYNFTTGINYLQGKNSSGKTEFYKFIDYMFGSSIEVSNEPWYKGTLKKATMEFTYGELTYKVSRTMDKNKNYFSYFDENDGESINLDEYRDKLEAVFAVDKDTLIKLRDFADERLTFRSFTVFNFLGEIRQGVLTDFFDKCSELKYSIKMASILNFIFNKNTELLYKLKKELEALKAEINKLERAAYNNITVRHKVNINLQKLNIGISYNGKNKDIIQKKIEEIKNMTDSKTPVVSKTIAELEVVHNNLDEQIKVYENYKTEMQTFQKENENREVLLKNLQSIINQNNDFEYLINPLILLTGELKNSISFNKYIISDETVKKLKIQRDKVKEEILKNDTKFIKYQLNDKAKAIAVIEDCISTDDEKFDSDELENKKKRASVIREQIKELSKANNQSKIAAISKMITMLYKSATDISEIVKQDFNDETFNIEYIKHGNILQTMAIRPRKDKEGNIELVNTIQPTGSLARHTLIQLCGYLAFLELLIREFKYPIIPILVLDHISKPFDKDNPRAIGKILNKAYELIGRDNLQTFIFDDEEYEKLGLTPDHHECLVDENKTGFNPFYFPEKTHNN